MAIHLHQNDLPDGLSLGPVVAIDTETMGLDPRRDRLCLVQLSSGDGNAHLVQIARGQKTAPNLERMLADPKVLKLFHFGRFDLRVPSVERFRAGLELTILELNGVTSEATHIYAPGASLLAAYRTLFEQWRLAFAIGAANFAAGAPATDLRTLFRLLRTRRSRFATIPAEAPQETPVTVASRPHPDQE